MPRVVCKEFPLALSALTTVAAAADQQINRRSVAGKTRELSEAGLGTSKKRLFEYARR